MMTLVLIVVGVCLLGAVVAAAGGFDTHRPARRVRRERVVRRPVRTVVEERVVERGL